MSEKIGEKPVEVSKPTKWFGEWMKERAFWREVTARALSGIIVVALGFVAAFSFGYIKTPGGVLAGLTGFFILSLAGIIVGVAVMYKRGWFPGRQKKAGFNIVIGAFLAVVAFIFVYVAWNVGALFPEILKVMVDDAAKVEV